MSFLRPAGADPATTGQFGAPMPLPIAGGARALGGAIGVDPSRISEIAGRVGTVANRFADIGGAAPGYEAPQIPQVPNHFQKLDPAFLQRIMQQFGGVR